MPEARQRTAENSAYAVDWEDMAEITVLYMSMSSLPDGVSEVEAAINAIMEEEINTHVTLQMVEGGNYDQQVSLMLAGGEPVDLMLTSPFGASTYRSMVSQKPVIRYQRLAGCLWTSYKKAVGDLWMPLR